MISVIIYRDSDGVIEQFVIKGHACAADPGEDIICAAVSALGQTAVLSLYQIANVNVKYEIRKGYLKCELPKNLAEKELHETKLLVDAMLLGLKNIQESYP